MALFKKKTWKNRLSEYPNRRKLTKEDGSTELVTVERSEGNISHEGDAFSEENMNDLETRIQDAIGTGDIPAELGTDIISAINALNTGIGSMIYLGQISIKENTDSSTKVLYVPKGYKGYWAKFASANGDASYGYIDTDFKSANLCIVNASNGNAFEKAYVVLNVDSLTITVTLSSKSNYQKLYGNNFTFWGVA